MIKESLSLLRVTDGILRLLPLLCLPPFFFVLSTILRPQRDPYFDVDPYLKTSTRNVRLKYTQRQPYLYIRKMNSSSASSSSLFQHNKIFSVARFLHVSHDPKFRFICTIVWTLFRSFIANRSSSIFATRNGHPFLVQYIIHYIFLCTSSSRTLNVLLCICVCECVCLYV